MFASLVFRLITFDRLNVCLIINFQSLTLELSLAPSFSLSRSLFLSLSPFLPILSSATYVLACCATGTEDLIAACEDICKDKAKNSHKEAAHTVADADTDTHTDAVTATWGASTRLALFDTTH